jgi:hypothetical protein
MVLTTAEARKGGMGEAERAALQKSMLAYTGKYHRAPSRSRPIPPPTGGARN